MIIMNNQSVCFILYQLWIWVFRYLFI